MCFCCGSRLATALAGIFFLIEALIWLFLSIAGLLAYKCKINIQQDFTAIIYYIYFYNEECAVPPQFLVDSLFTLPPGFTVPSELPSELPGGYTIPGGFTIPTIPTIWPDVVEPSQRTYQWIHLYIILSAIWAFASLLLIIGSCVGCKGFHAVWFYLPGVLVTLAVIISDVVATVTYGMDIKKTENFNGLLTFIGIKDLEVDGIDVMVELDEKAGDKSELAVIPSVVMVVIFSRAVILWIINVVVFFRIFSAMWKIMKQKRHKQDSRRKDSTESDDAWGWSISRSTKRSFKGFMSRPKSSADDAAERKRKEQAAKEDAENNSDFLRVLSNHNEVRSSLKENGMPPTELRSQLPWSYFSSRDDPSRPPKPTKLTKEPMPPVPPPDYTLRFPQSSSRPSLPGQNPHHPGGGRSDGPDRNSVEGSTNSHHRPHGKDLSGATPVFPFTIAPEGSERRVPPRVPAKPYNSGSFGSGINSNWIRKAPDAPQAPRVPKPDYDGGGSYPPIPVPDYSRPASVPVIPSPDYSDPVTNGPGGGAVWRQKPLHVAPHVITKTPFNQGRNTANGYF